MRPRHARPELDGWRTMRARSDDGAFESDERVRVAGPVVEFSVTDDGVGIALDRVRDGAGGLLELGSRLGALGGTLTVENAPAGGLVVRGSVPAESRVRR